MTEPRELQRITTGIPGLDTVLAGGLFESGIYIVQGPPGAGAAADEQGLFLTFYEQPGDLIAKATRLGLTSIAPAIERGALRILWQSSVEADSDFDPTIREMLIGDRGIELGPPIAGAPPTGGGGAQP